ncbi:hypothetical protein BSKO_10339 [Bryopsis sp. KO-2023]|nr:hypothetical protein BSKO_10339 [Bryopsis sp. KO-2023]
MCVPTPDESAFHTDDHLSVSMFVFACIESIMLMFEIVVEYKKQGIPGSPEVCKPEEIKIPLQGHFGVLESLKEFSDIETAQGVEARMKAAGCPSEFFYYEGAGHAL